MGAAVPVPVHAEAADDLDRLAAVERYDLLDTPREEAFDRITRLIRLTLGVEVGIVSLIDAHRQWYKSVDGLDGREAPLDVTFCRHVLIDGQPITVSDATTDPRFQNSPFVTGDPHVRSYASVPLRTGDGHTIGTVCAIGSSARDFSPREQAILAELAAIAMDEIELRQIATVDSLTGTLTRRAFKEDAQKFIALARRHRSPLSCITFDIDHFKAINDTYGHPGGDQVLIGVARAVTEQLRQSDLLGRLGGEEFAVLLPLTDRLHALEVAEKLRLHLRTLKFPGSHPPIAITASFGVATFDHDSDDIDGLLAKTDEALYDAKRTGRNKCAVWQAAGAVVPFERRRVLKAGKIVLGQRTSTIDCSVRAIWDTGAELTVSTTMGIPPSFTLRIPSDSAEWSCKVSGRTEQRLTVEFD